MKVIRRNRRTDQASDQLLELSAQLVELQSLVHRIEVSLTELESTITQKPRRKI
jgi:hypothetical protein